MTAQLELGDIAVDVVLKDIKNVHLSVHPPTGRVRIAAPERMKMDAIRLFAISKLGWIKKQQLKLHEQERETPREYLERESHFVWGKRYLLRLVEHDGRPKVELRHRELALFVPPKAAPSDRRAVLDAWYREQLKEAIRPLIAKWEARLGVKVQRLFVQRMKTKWGSCNSDAGNIRLNLQLAKKPPTCLEYVVVHEMIHLLERSHNDRFQSLMNQFMPQWRLHREELNRAPLSHVDWGY